MKAAWHGSSALCYYLYDVVGNIMGLICAHVETSSRWVGRQAPPKKKWFS